MMNNFNFNKFPKRSLDLLLTLLKENFTSELKRQFKNNFIQLRILTFTVNHLKEEKSFINHTECVSALILANNNKNIVSGSDDASLKIWDISTCQCLSTLTEHDDFITCLLNLTPNHFASGSDDNTIKIWDFPTRKCLKTLTGHANNVISLVNLGTNFFVSGSEDEIKIWENGGSCLRTIKIGIMIKRLIVINQVIVCSGPEDIQVWDLLENKHVKSLSGHSREVNSLVNLTESVIGSGGDDKDIRIWEVKTGNCLRVLKGHKISVISLVKLDEWRLASGSVDNSIKVWEWRNGSCLTTLYEDSGIVYCLVRLNVYQVVSGNGDNSVRIRTCF